MAEDKKTEAESTESQETAASEPVKIDVQEHKEDDAEAKPETDESEQEDQSGDDTTEPDEEKSDDADDEVIELEEEEEAIEDDVLDDDAVVDEVIKEQESEDSEATEDGESTEVEANDSDKHESHDSSEDEQDGESHDDKAVDDLLKVEKDDPHTPSADDQHAAQAAAASAATATSDGQQKAKHPLIAKIKRGFHYWWTHKKLRYGTLVALFLGITALAIIPTTRYSALNLFGVRVDATVTVTNLESGLPLENIPVTLDGLEVRTDENGQANFSERKLGDNDLVIDKLGYAAVNRVVTLGLGSNPGVTQEIDATGAQYRFSLKQWLSDDAKVMHAKAISGEDIARVNEQGELLLTVSDLSPEAVVTISADGYREEVIPVSELEQELTELELVPDYTHSFVSNRSGEYDLYSIDIDAMNESSVLAATGVEREIPYALANDDGSRVAYVTSRDGEENADGFILDGLYIVDVESGENERITRSEQLQLVGWNGDTLIYVAVVEGVSAGNPQRSRIFSYNVETTKREELASANYFNDVELVGDRVYYSVSSFAVPRSRAKLFSIDTAGSETAELVVDAQVWTIGYRDTNTLLFSAEDREWYEQDIASGEVTQLDTAPPVNAQRDYEFRGESALRVETRDGRGTLLLTRDGEEQTVLAEAGVSIPIVWVNDDYAIYRITTGSESADYVVRLDNGNTQKITDVVGNRSRYFF